ncbi:unnamed protein product [Lactuca virosa]|uniref:RRM domain-containing protein n=1 Tax=Lactuca virosa TaxID=75947 RepID=A0AAU9NWW7_9ASTR|nr:unnamed protein product [Lactuca virosa]
MERGRSRRVTGSLEDPGWTKVIRRKKISNQGWIGDHSRDVGGAATTFFVANIPENWNAARLWKVFQRFIKVENEERLEREMNEIQLGGKKLIANVSKFKRRKWLAVRISKELDQLNPFFSIPILYRWPEALDHMLMWFPGLSFYVRIQEDGDEWRPPGCDQEYEKDSEDDSDYYDDCLSDDERNGLTGENKDHRDDNEKGEDGFQSSVIRDQMEVSPVNDLGKEEEEFNARDASLPEVAFSLENEVCDEDMGSTEVNGNTDGLSNLGQVGQTGLIVEKVFGASHISDPFENMMEEFSGPGSHHNFNTIPYLNKIMETYVLGISKSEHSNSIREDALKRSKSIPNKAFHQ